jgi:D-glycero-D-manno-heptose 1,7-bisphosphate phosphatase
LTALAQLAQLGVPILVISNQSAIGRGLANPTIVDEIHQRARAIIEEAGGRIDAFFVCPHHPADGCACRKPKPGLLWQASAAYRLDLTQCIFIGDAVTDYQAATSAGCQSILVQTGRQGGELIRRLGSEPALPIVADLLAAAALILAVHSEHDD